MTHFMLFLCFIISTVSATSPIRNETDDSVVPDSRPVPVVPRRCPLNEVLKSKAPCPPDTCNMLYVSVLCIANQTESVVCTCKDGYLRTNSTPTGVCVPQDRCLPPECADDPNAIRGCGNRCGKTCADYNDTNIVCKEEFCNLYGCECKEGYVYDKNVNKCVDPKQCTKQCTKPHQRYSTCLLGECVPKSCDQLGYPIPCPGPSIGGSCEGGCICEEGYVTDSNGDCIEKNKCPSCGGDPNAVAGCGNPCGKTCESLYTNKSDLICPLYCELNGCDCKSGYRLFDADNSKKCIPEADCPKRPHEIYIDCPAGQCNPKTCDDLVTPPGCPRIIPPCPGGCVCVEGYLKASNGTCIKKEQCPSTQCTKPNQRYSNCLLGECVPKKCGDVGYPVACPDIIGPCAGDCTCIEGYVKDFKGNCIDMKKCPSCGGDSNAVSGCGNPCGKTCASLYANNSDLICPQYCEYNGCDCKPGYRLLDADNSDSKKCIPERDCPKPPQLCDKNEQYYCGTSCPEATCASPTPPNCFNKKCKRGCFCKKGFVRNAEKKCIPIGKCPPQHQCKGPNEKYIDCPVGQCNPKTCQDLITPPPCPRVRPPCPGGCVCIAGYLRNPAGKCVKKELCPQFSCTANQTYVSCNVNCPDKYCPKDDRPQPICDPPRNCPPGCTCKINYRYDQSGNCILASECPPVNCTGKNMEWNSCPSACLAEQCEDADSPPVVCNTLLLNCQPRCVCKRGHFKNSDGVCVPAKECPSVCKDPFASWKDCKDACPATCQNTRPNCVNKMCSPGCQCNEGYVLSKPGGKCVKIDTCADYSECGANQTIVPCTFKCPQVMCPKSDQTILCKPPRDCPGGCGCKPYYRYNATGDCVKASDCTPIKCTRPNEQFACQRVYAWERCEDRYNSPPFNPGHPDDCTPKCVCRKGFWRDAANKCVPADQCKTDVVPIPTPEPQKCPENEVLKKRKLCPPDTCDSLYLSFLCVAEQNDTLVCTCKDGYLRTNATGGCVPQDRCLPPECTNDPNAKRGCGDRCKKTCADYNDTSKVCANRACKLFGCDCQDGFVYDEIKKICVKPSQCTPKCKGPKEKYINCPAGQCNPKTCKDLITPPGCPRIRPPCPGGCVCQDGYLKSSKGICIKKEQCPQPACSGNQTYVTCNVNCPDKYCPKDDMPQPVCDPPRNCSPGCTCKINYRYDQSGKCILASECPPVNCTGQNMEWNSCPSACLAEQCEDADSPPAVCNTLLLDCQPRCVCKPGHFKNSDGICVPAKECPSVCKDPNASWKDCKDICPGTCQNTRPICISKKICSPGCQCNDGYVLSKTGGKCVQIENCTDYAECGANQTFVSCTYKCPQVMCPESDQTILCKPPRDCPGGCGCKPNYRYNADGECIKGSDCPPVECTRPNEEWAPCRSEFDWERCDDRFNSPPFVPAEPEDCNPRCVCKKGFWRNNSGECVMESECPPIA